VSDSVAIVIPRETVNDDFVTIIKWHVGQGSQVRSGDTLLEFETSKAVIIVEAEQDGYVEIFCPGGESVPVGEKVGRLHLRPLAGVACLKDKHDRPQRTSSTDQRISRKARELIEQKGIDLAVFKDLSFVREADVLRYIEKRKAVVAGQGDIRTAAEVSTFVSAKKKGFLNNAREAAKSRGHSVFWLACNYLFRNYLLSLMVRVAPRGIILVLHRLRGVKMGKNCYIDPTAVIETAYPENIIIGNDVFITAHTVIMTHIKGPHYLRDAGLVPQVLKKVVLEDHCFIGVNAVIMPGVTVGKASVVASGAVVVTNVPPHVMVAGNPAMVVKKFSVSERAKD